MRTGDSHHLETINDVPVIFLPLSSRRAAIVEFTYGTGSRFEADKERGISHFLEHSVFRSGKKYPSGPAISGAIERVGGDMNASTGKEYTNYHAVVPSKQVALAADVLTDMLVQPKWRDAGLRIERRAVQSEIRMYEDDSEAHAYDLFEQALWGDSPLGRNVLGTHETVSSFTGRVCDAYMRRCYVPSNMVVTVAGTFDMKTARDTLAAGLAGMTFHGNKPGAPAPAIVSTTPVVHEYRDIQQANVFMGTDGVGLNDPDRPAMLVLDTLLGGSAGPLFVQIREKRGLAYSVYPMVDFYAETGLFGIGFGCETDAAAEAVKLGLQEVQRLAHSVSERRLESAKQQLAGSIELGLDSPKAISSGIAKHYLRTGKIGSPTDLIKQIEKVSRADVRRVATKLMEQPWRASIVSSHHDITPIEQALTLS
jgi:predicted Zn-dependent peptidase